MDVDLLVESVECTRHLLRALQAAQLVLGREWGTELCVCVCVCVCVCMCKSEPHALIHCTLTSWSYNLAGSNHAHSSTLWYHKPSRLCLNDIV